MLLNSIQKSFRFLRCTNVLPSQKIKTLISSQRYVSWLHRRPSAVINDEIVLSDVEATPKPRKYVNEDIEHRPLRVRPRHRPIKAARPTSVIASNKETFNADGSLNFTPILNDNRELSAHMMNLKSKKMREKSQQILVEGHRLITDAIKAGLKLNMILFSRVQDVAKIPLSQRDVQLFKVPYKTLQLWSSLTTTPGIMGAFELPKSFEKETMKDSIPVTIICDNVREPGNLGTILRAAAGAGCERVILTKGCVDLWDSKVLRSAAGGHFRVSLSNSVDWETIESLISPTAKIFAADNNVIVNSETESKPPVVEAADFDSEYDEGDDDDDNDDNNDVQLTASPDESESTEKAEEQSVEYRPARTRVDGSHENMSKAFLKELAKTIPIIPYYAVDYTKNEIVLIVGGEADGLSYNSIQLIRERDGVRINVPLTNDVESLNTGMALGILAFEIRKQFLMRKDDLIK